MFKTTIKRNKKEENSFEVKFEGMTAGKIMALENALQLYKEKSAVAEDVYLSLRYAVELNPDAKQALGEI